MTSRGAALKRHPAGSGIAVESQNTVSYRMVIGDRKNRNRDQLFGGSVSKFQGKT